MDILQRNYGPEIHFIGCLILVYLIPNSHTLLSETFLLFLLKYQGWEIKVYIGQKLKCRRAIINLKTYIDQRSASQGYQQIAFPDYRINKIPFQQNTVFIEIPKQEKEEKNDNKPLASFSKDVGCTVHEIATAIYQSFDSEGIL